MTTPQDSAREEVSEPVSTSYDLASKVLNHFGGNEADHAYLCCLFSEYYKTKDKKIHELEKDVQHLLELVGVYGDELNKKDKGFQDGKE